MTLGEKLQALRKQNGLSQEALAEKLAVTRQTVSKWERNCSLPDLDFIARLSELFHVSADYLIREEQPMPDAPPMPKKAFQFTRKAKRTVLMVLSLAELTAGFVCLVCDHFTSKTLSWSLIVLAALAAAWFVLLPLLTAKEKVIFKTLAAVSIVPFPLLAVLALFLKRAVLFTLGSCVALVCISAVWVIDWIFQKNRVHLWRALGFALLVILPIPAAITYLTAHFLPQTPFDLPSTLFNSGITLLLSLACFGVEHLRSSKQEEP